MSNKKNSSDSKEDPSVDQLLWSLASGESSEASELEKLNVAERVAKVKEQDSTRKLKTIYACGFLFILFVQLCVMNGVFIFTGLDKLEFNKWTLELYMSGTMLEVFAIALVITRHLFPKKNA